MNMPTRITHTSLPTTMPVTSTSAPHVPSPVTTPGPTMTGNDNSSPTTSPSKPKRRRDPALDDKRWPGEIVEGPRRRKATNLYAKGQAIGPRFVEEEHLSNLMMCEAHANAFFDESGLLPTEFYKASNTDPDTLTYDEAMSDPDDLERWIEAAEKEIRTLEDMETWEEVLVSEAKGHIVPTHWVFKKKRKPDGTIDKYKGRLVVRGDLMKDYDFETHAPVASWSTIRMVLILSLAWGWHTCTCDYSNAFVHAKLDTPVWIQIPRGYTSTLPGRTCLRLKRSLYGTTFAPKLWSDCLFDALKAYGLEQSTNDPCLFAKPGMMVCTFVDDLAIAVKDPDETKKFVSKMKELGFDLTMDDSLTSFLGIKFERRNDGSFNMTQPALIDKIIEATGLENCNRNFTPAAPNQTLGKDPDGEPMSESWSYPSVCGMLLYLSTNTRPDIAFAVSQICRFTHCPKKSHAKAVKILVRYLSGTKEHGSIMKPDGTLSLTAYSDADFCGLYKSDPMEDPSSAKSRMGYIISLGGCPLVWKSQLIPSTTLATAESEYYSLSHCLRVLIPIIRTLKELTQMIMVDRPLRASIRATAFEDNSAALQLANTHRLTSRTRYYHAQAHHFWEYMNEHPDELSIQPIETSLQDADYATKALPREPFEANRRRVQGW